MKNLKKVCCILLTLTMVLSLVACGGKEEVPAAPSAPAATGKTEAPAPAEKMVWSMGHTFADGSLMDTYADEFAARIAEETDGQIEITVYPASQLGSAAEQLEQCGLGSIEIGWGDFSSSSGVDPIYNMVSLPFFFQGYDEVKEFLKSEPCQQLLDLYVEKGNVRQLGNWMIGPRHFAFPEKYTTYDELSKLTARTPEITVYIETYKAFGMNPTTVAFSEIYNAFQANLIDCADANLDTIISAQWYTLNKYVMMTGWCYQIGGPVINEDLWQSLTPELQETVMAVAEEVAAAQIEGFIADEQDKMAQLEQEGCTVYDFYEDFQDTQKVIDNCANNVWPQIIAGDAEMQKFVDDTQALFGR